MCGTDSPRAPHGAARLDRIYVMSKLRGQKVWVETVFAAFTDHLAVCLRIKLKAPRLQRGRGLWNTNTKLLGETTFKTGFSKGEHGGDYMKENTRTGLRCGRDMSKEKSVSLNPRKNREDSRRYDK